jgi:hypothetical protein
VTADTPRAPKPRKPAGNARRDLFAAAVLTGLSASNGVALMSAAKPERDLAVRSLRRFAYLVADEMISGEPA